MNSSSEKQQEQASLYVAGALSEQEQGAFEADLRDNAELRDLVRDLQRAADLLALAVPRVELPPGLKDKVLQRIEKTTAARAFSAEPDRPPRAAMPGFIFHNAGDDKGWKELPLPGAWIKLLSIDRERGYAVLMGKLEAGVHYPAHTHTKGEELYILTGDLHIGDRTLGPGDFHHADAGVKKIGVRFQFR